MQPLSTRRQLLTRLGLALLVAGIGAGALIYASAPKANAGEDWYLSPDDSRRYDYDVEKNFGKVGALAERWTRAASALAEPKPLGATIMILSALGAAGCFLARGGVKS